MIKYAPRNSVLSNHLFVVLRRINQTLWPSLSIIQNAVMCCASDLAESSRIS